MSAQKPIVINGHGAKTNHSFNINGHTLLTPGNLNTPYVFAIDPNYDIEKDFQQYKVKNVKNGHWTFYDQSISPKVNDVSIAPWQQNELKSFAHNILTNPSYWANIDNHHQYYLLKDPNAVLVIKHGNHFFHLNTQETKTFLTKVENGTYSKMTDGTPLFFYADKIGKVKILGHTSLSEVLDQIDQVAGPKLIMLATCNAAQQNKIISYDTHSSSQDVVKLAKAQGVDLQHGMPNHDHPMAIDAGYSKYLKGNLETDFQNKLTLKNHSEEAFNKQNFTYGPLNKSLFTQGLELLTKCVLKDAKSIEFYSTKNQFTGRTDYHAKIADMDINVSELMKKANFSHIQFDQNYMSNAEKSAISDYTGSAYYKINNFLWGKEVWNADLSGIFVKSMQIASGLNKIMPDTDYHSFTYRGDKPSYSDICDRIELIKQGGGISESEAFFSTSLDRETATWFSGDAVIYFEDRYGKKVSGLSHFPGEQEYLLEPSTLLWTKHECINGKHIFHARKVVPLVEGKDSPTHDDISMFNKLNDWAKNHGVNTDFITPHLKSTLEDDIKPQSCSTAIRLDDCITLDNHTIPGLDQQNTIAVSNAVSSEMITPPAMVYQGLAPMQEVHHELAI